MMNVVQLIVVCFVLEVCSSVVHDQQYESSDGKCVIEKNFTSPFVTASFEVFPAYESCRSSERGKHGVSVHTIVLTDTDHESRMNFVNIFLRVSGKEYSGKKNIFVLLSSKPVIYRIYIQNSTTQFAGIFWINNHSSLERDRNVKARVKDIPSNIEASSVSHWIREKWGAITSFIQLSMANLITLDIDEDGAILANQCEPSRREPTSLISMLNVKSISGCTDESSRHDRRRDVHIIELMKASNTSSVEGGDVVVSLRPRKRKPPINKHLILILQSHTPVRWKILSESFRGNLDIITDQPVDLSSVRSHDVRSAAEKLVSLSGSGLIEWTRERYGDPLSYTHADVANYFDLLINGDEYISTRRDIGGSDSGLLVTGPRPTGLYETASEREEIRLAVMKAMTISCKDGYVNVTLEKAPLMEYEVLDNITLLDPTCIAQSNVSHYFLGTRSSDCSTRQRISGNSITYNNTLRLWLRQYPDEPELRVNFKCGHEASGGSTVVNRGSVVEFGLGIFRDVAMKDEITALPAIVSERAKLYVRGSIKPSGQLTDVVLSDCLLETSDVQNQDVSNVVKSNLIINGCIVDKSVEWLDGHVNGFQFSAAKCAHCSHSVVTIKCSLVLCSTLQHSMSDGLQQCPSQKTFCENYSTIKSHLDHKVQVSKGPLVVNEAVDQVSSHDNDRQHAMPEDCHPVIIIDGLESEAVIGIAFASFFIGVLLTAAIWIIFVKTGRKHVSKTTKPNKLLGGPISADSSGNSTPCSTVPLAINRRPAV